MSLAFSILLLIVLIPLLDSLGNPSAELNSAQTTSPSLLCSPTTIVLIEFAAPAFSARALIELSPPSASPDVAFRPLILNVSQGYYINILRVRASGVLSRHRHRGLVHALMLRGRWRYLEHHWVASAGDYTFEPAGEAHTLVVPDNVQEMATLFHVTGGYTYVDPYGAALGYEDVFTKLERASRSLRVPRAWAGLRAAVCAMKRAANRFHQQF